MVTTGNLESTVELVGLSRTMVAPQDKQRQFGYDAVEEIGRRRYRRISRRSEDVELHPSLRRVQLICNTRDLVRNFPAAAWAVQHHVDAVAGEFTFQSRSGDPGLDRDIDTLFDWWSRPQNCDIASRHSFQELVKLTEEGAVVTGDGGLLLCRGYKLQGIEGDRINSIAPGVPDGATWPEPGKFFNGVKCDKNGKAISYCLCRRLFDAFEYEREIPSAALVMHGYYWRMDQVRGITPLASAVNSFADAYDVAFAGLQKMKQAAVYGFIQKSDEYEDEIKDAFENGEDPYSIDLSKGPFKLRMPPSDALEWMKAEWPSIEYQKFYQETIRLALKSLSCPACLYFDGETNMSEHRAKIDEWHRYIEQRRDVLRTALNRIWAWRLLGFIEEGVLTVGKRTIDDLKWEWVAPGPPVIDPMTDAKCAALEIAAGISSQQRVCKERGYDAMQILEEQAQWHQARQKLGVPQPQYGIIAPQQPEPDIRAINLDD